MRSLCEYFESHDSNVVRWAHVKNNSKARTIYELLKYLMESNLRVQILYANDAKLNEAITFEILLALLKKKTIWAVNMGECVFSQEQCKMLLHVVEHDSCVAFMFVDAIYVGNVAVRALKDVIRTRRRKSMNAPWLLGENQEQNSVIFQCRSMWFNPLSLGRNKHFLEHQ